jgi:hypothetical protein
MGDQQVELEGSKMLRSPINRPPPDILTCAQHVPLTNRSAVMFYYYDTSIIVVLLL